MNQLVEKQVWDYIDNELNPSERKRIEALLNSDPEYKAAYAEIVKLNAMLAGSEIEEPSMGFTRNVMDKITAEPVPRVLKSLVDKRIIGLIFGFFVFTILYLLIIVFTQTDFKEFINNSSVKFALPEFSLSNHLNRVLINGFVFADIIIALYLLDGFLRKRI